MSEHMTNNRIGQVVMQSKNGVIRYGVITFQRMKDRWMHYTIFWISKTGGESDWLSQIEWRCDAVSVIDEAVHLRDLQSAIRFRSSRKFKEETGL